MFILFVFADHGVVSPSTGVIEKANILFLNKEAAEKDWTLKTQLLLSSSNSQSGEKISEAVWKKNGFFFLG